MITLRNITLRRGTKVVLQNASVTLQPGEKVGLIGRNGAGKSSLFALLTDRLHADNGDVEIPPRWRVGEVAREMPETEDGTLYAANVPAASGKPLRADLSARLDRDVRLDNDANCFALSEAWDDEFTQYPLVMGLILGTGVGGGLVLNGKSITGRSYITGEFGHIRLPVDALTLMGFDFPLRRCGCGQLGCIER